MDRAFLNSADAAIEVLASTSVMTLGSLAGDRAGTGTAASRRENSVQQNPHDATPGRFDFVIEHAALQEIVAQHTSHASHHSHHSHHSHYSGR